MQNKNILVIDEDTETLRLVSEVLEHEGLAVFVVTDSENTLPMIEKIEPALILVETNLSGMSGLRLCQDIHRVEGFRNIPIILLTREERRYDPGYAADYGVVGFIRKPIVAEELLSKVRDVLTTEESVMVDFSRFEDVLLSKVNEIFRERPPERPGGTAEEPHEAAVTEDAPADDSGGDVVAEGAPVDAAVSGAESAETGGEGERPRPPRRRYRKRRKTSPLLAALGGGVLLLLIVSAIYLKTGKEGPTAPDETAVMKTEQSVQAGETLERGDTEVSTIQPQEEETLEETESSVEEVAEDAPPPEEPVTPEPPLLSIQVGAFRNPANAETMKQRLESKGYRAGVYPSGGAEEGVIYRVLIGRFDTREEALRRLREIKEAEGIEAVLFRR